MTDAPLSLDQALRLAITHHQEGRLADAEHVYRAILETEPGHADANHNLGVLAVQLGKPELSLSYLKAALEANPAQGQYWLSLIETLITLGRSADARAILAAGLQRGLSGPVVEGFQARLQDRDRDPNGPKAVQPTPAAAAGPPISRRQRRTQARKRP